MREKLENVISHLVCPIISFVRPFFILHILCVFSDRMFAFPTHLDKMKCLNLYTTLECPLQFPLSFN